MGDTYIPRRSKRESELTYQGKKYKSKLEVEARKILPEYITYETDKIKYVKEHTYNPDWQVDETTFIETKGLFTAQDRQRHLDIKKQFPEITIYFVFGNPNNKLNRNSTTTYADWCAQHDYEWSTIDLGIPKHWLKSNK